MKAVVYKQYGGPDVLRFAEVPMPVPGPGEVLIRIHATTVNSGDWRVRSLEVPAGFGLLSRLALGIRGPRQPILGTELSGVVASVGRDVTKFKAGDAVFAFPGVRMGCHAEYRCMAQDAAVARKPANLSHAQAAALSFGGTTALHFLRKARLGAGKSVLVNGASGAVGTAAVQLAKHFGAEVTAVCSGRNAALVTSLGADHVIDYTKEDFTRNGRAYDVIIDTAGTAPFARSRASLRDGGQLLVVLGGLRDLLRIPWVALTDSRKVVGGTATATAEDLRFLAGLAERGELRPVIDRTYRFDEIVEAHRYVDTGRKTGSVVITLES
ncbi:MAG TPA: NAD(P)-dependent alcohol dehydrogenase [Thermoanaerobaculia bacterium]|nr:NAD(P)-dependent alcohol dehydrogenase [Thermoanaerobaculia bacterium]